MTSGSRCPCCDSTFDHDIPTCSNTLCGSHSQTIPIQDDGERHSSLPTITVCLPDMSDPIRRTGWDTRLLPLEAGLTEADIGPLVRDNSWAIPTALEPRNRMKSRPNETLIAKSWFEDVGPATLRANPRASAGVVSSKTIRHHKYDYHIQRKLEPSTEPWLFVVRCDSLQAAQLLNSADHEGPVCVLNYRDCLPSRYIRRSFETRSLCLRTTLWWSLKNAERERKRQGHEVRASGTYEDVTVSPDVLVVRMDQVKDDVEHKMTEEVDRFHINVLTVDRVEHEWEDAAIDEDRLASKLEAVMNLGLSLGSDCIVLRSWECSYLQDKTGPLQASALGRLLRKTWKTSGDHNGKETWHTRGFKKVVVAVDDSTADLFYGNEFWDPFEWDFQHCPGAVVDPEHRLLEPGASFLSTGRPYTRSRPFEDDWRIQLGRAYQPLTPGPRDVDTTSIRRRYLAHILRLHPEDGSHPLLRRVEAEVPVSATPNEQAHGPAAARAAHVLQDMLSQLNIDYVSDVFIPLRRLYLRHAYMQIQSWEAPGDIPWPADDHMLAQWTIYCRSYENCFLELYSDLQKLLLHFLRVAERYFDSPFGPVSISAHDVDAWLAAHLEPRIWNLYHGYQWTRYGVQYLHQSFDEDFSDFMENFFRSKLLELPFQYQPQWEAWPDDCPNRSQILPNMPVLPRLPNRDVWQDVAQSTIPFSVEENLLTMRPYPEETVTDDGLQSLPLLEGNT